MTLGHVIIGRDPNCLDSCRDHEQAHVRQVERWGGAFIPAYLTGQPLGLVARRALLSRQLVRARRPPRLRRAIWVIASPTPAELLSLRCHRNAPRRAPLHRERVRPRHRHRHVRRPDGPVRAGGGALGRGAIRHRIIVTAGLAEIAAGSIAMGLGGYLAARSDAEHYASEKRARSARSSRLPRGSSSPRWPTSSRPTGSPTPRSRRSSERLRGQPEGLGRLHDALRAGPGGARPRRAPEQRPDDRRRLHRRGAHPAGARTCSCRSRSRLLVSVAVTLLALFVFGYVKGRFTGTRPIAKRLADRPDRRPRRGGRVPDREGVL